MVLFVSVCIVQKVGRKKDPLFVNLKKTRD